MCVQYIIYYIRFDLFVEMREEGRAEEELWDRCVEVCFVFVSSSLVAINCGHIIIGLRSVYDTGI